MSDEKLYMAVMKDSDIVLADRKDHCLFDLKDLDKLLLGKNITLSDINVYEINKVKVTRDGLKVHKLSEI